MIDLCSDAQHNMPHFDGQCSAGHSYGSSLRFGWVGVYTLEERFHYHLTAKPCWRLVRFPVWYSQSSVRNGRWWLQRCRLMQSQIQFLSSSTETWFLFTKPRWTWNPRTGRDLWNQVQRWMPERRGERWVKDAAATDQRIAGPSLAEKRNNPTQTLDSLILG